MQGDQPNRLPSLHPCLLAAIPVRPPGGSHAACSSLALSLCFVVLVSCYGSMQEVSEPSLESPRPPEWWQGQGNGEASRTSLASPFPCPCHHSPVRPPGGSQLLVLSLLVNCSLLTLYLFSIIFLILRK